MTELEYEAWKQENPGEWEETWKATLQEFLEQHKENQDSDIIFESPCADPTKRVYTWGRIKEALQGKTDCCDLLVRQYRQGQEYRKKRDLGLLVLLPLLFLLWSCGESYRLKGGTAVTVEGDTIEFYGGVINPDINYHNRTIERVVIKEKKNE